MDDNLIDRVNRKSYRNITLFLLWLILIFSKVFQYLFLPNKYFFDSKAIMKYMTNTPRYVDRAYRFTASVFKHINIFNISSLIVWSILITAVFGVITYRLIYKNTMFTDLTMFIYLCSGVFLLGIYVFNISKEILQYTIFLILYYIIKKSSYEHRYFYVILCSMIFILESIIFRSYYIVTAAFCFFIFVVIDLLDKGKIKQRTGIISALLIMIALLMSFMVVSKYAMPSEYNAVLNVRSVLNYNREGADNAVTIITDVFNSNGNLVLWLINYIITAIRMLFPFELLFKSVAYVPFIIFQLIITFYFILSYKRLFNFKNTTFVLSLCVFTSFLLTSVMFEPDFGSWLRHECTTLPVTILFVSQLTNDKLCSAKIRATY